MSLSALLNIPLPNWAYRWILRSIARDLKHLADRLEILQHDDAVKILRQLQDIYAEAGRKKS